MHEMFVVDGVKQKMTILEVKEKLEEVSGIPRFVTSKKVID